MRRIDIVKRASRNLKKTKVRTLLTSLAIAVGATTISLALAAGQGGRDYVNGIAGKIGDIHAIDINKRYDANSQKNGPEKKTAQDTNSQASIFESMKKYSLGSELADKISKIKGVRRVRQRVGMNLETVRYEQGEKYSAQGQVQVNDQEKSLSAGSLNAHNEIPKGKVIIPKSYVEAFGFKNPTELIGKKAIFEFRTFTGEIVERTYEITAVDAGKTEDSIRYIEAFEFSNEDGVEVAKLSYGGEYNSGLTAVVDGTRPTEQVQNEIKKLDDTLLVNSFKDSQKSVSQAVNIAAAGLAGFGVLTVFASVFGIINTQYISVLERTQQIGLMKSLGMSRADISKLFRYEAAWIGFLGGVIGVMIAWGFTFLNPTISQVLRLGSNVQLLQMDWLGSSIMVLCLMLVAVISGYLPARKAARLNPVEALRTE